jgi:hypothetical protein
VETLFAPNGISAILIVSHAESTGIRHAFFHLAVLSGIARHCASPDLSRRKKQQFPFRRSGLGGCRQSDIESVYI